MKVLCLCCLNWSQILTRRSLRQLSSKLKQVKHRDIHYFPLRPLPVHNELLFKSAEAFIVAIAIASQSIMKVVHRTQVKRAHMFRAIPPSLHIAAAPTGSASIPYPTKVSENAHLFLWTLLLSTKIASSRTSTAMHKNHRHITHHFPSR